MYQSMSGKNIVANLYSIWVFLSLVFTEFNNIVDAFHPPSSSWLFQTLNFKNWNSPGWCGSMAWAPTCHLRGYLFDSQSGHMPGLQARSPAGGVREATNRCSSHTSMFLSLSPSCPISLKIILKIFKK